MFVLVHNWRPGLAGGHSAQHSTQGFPRRALPELGPQLSNVHAVRHARDNHSDSGLVDLAQCEMAAQRVLVQGADDSGREWPRR